MANTNIIVGGLINPTQTEIDPLAIKLSDLIQTVQNDSTKIASSAAIFAELANKATPAQITTAINNLVNAAPSALDTLNELATALGNDASFATTITTALAGKASSSHTHSQSDITNLISDLAGKASSSHSHVMSDITGLVSALAGKAAPSDITTAINSLINSAPGALDTLAELATALGNDASFATTITTALAGKEPTITAGSTAQYIKGDKTLGTMDKSAVGLANVDNTTDAGKPVSTATQTALDLKLNIADASGLPTFTFGETITAGDILYQKQSDGKAYKMPNLSPVYTTSPFDTTNWDLCINPTNNTLLAVGKQTSQYVGIRAGTISAGVVTWGTRVDLYSSVTSPTMLKILYNSSQNVFVICYSDLANSSYMTFVGVSVSGTTITKGTPVVASIAIGSFSACSMGTTAYIGIGYYKNVAAVVAFRTISVSGTALTLNTELASSINVNAVGITYDSSALEMFGVIGTSSIKIATLTNTTGTLTVTKGTLAVPTLSNINTVWSKASNNKESIIVAYKGYLYVFVTDSSYPNSLAIIKFAPTSISSANDYFIAVSTIPLGFTNKTLGNGPNGISVYNNLFAFSLGSNEYFTIDLDTCSYINANIYSGIGGSGLCSSFILFDGYFAEIGNAQTYGAEFKSVVGGFVNPSDILGVANESGVLGGVKKVNIKGTVYTTTGLTAGARYYGSRTGVLSSTDNAVNIGRAISTTQLLIGA